MLTHIVLYKFKENTPDVAAEVKKRFSSMKGKIEELKDISFGSDVTHSARSYDFALVCTFENAEGLQKYLDHPVHAPVRAFMHSVTAESKSVDFEIK